jgi:hypothetical protein
VRFAVRHHFEFGDSGLLQLPTIILSRSPSRARRIRKSGQERGVWGEGQALGDRLTPERSVKGAEQDSPKMRISQNFFSCRHPPPPARSIGVRGRNPRKKTHFLLCQRLFWRRGSRFLCALRSEMHGGAWDGSALTL